MRPEDIGALTDAPILSDDIEYDDEGEVVRVGAVYWYPRVRRFGAYVDCSTGAGGREQRTF